MVDKNLWKEYIKERLGQELTETDKGFITWHIESFGDDKVLSLNDIYVSPEYRDSVAAMELYNLAKAQGEVNNCKYIVAYVEANLPEARKRLLAYLVKLDLNILKAENNNIVLYKEL